MDPKRWRKAEALVDGTWREITVQGRAKDGTWEVSTVRDGIVTRWVDRADLRELLTQAEREERAAGSARVAAERRGVTVDDDEVHYRGRLVQYVLKGRNDEWFMVGLGEISEAYPIRGRDAIRGMGSPTKWRAVLRWAVDEGLRPE